MDTLKKWLYEQRYKTILPIAIIIGIILTGGMSKPLTRSPISGNKVDAEQLRIEFDHMIAQYKYSAELLQEQLERRDKIAKFITALASGQATNWGGVANLALSAGLLSAFLNISGKSKEIVKLKNGTKKVDSA